MSEKVRISIKAGISELRGSIFGLGVFDTEIDTILNIQIADWDVELRLKAVEVTQNGLY